MSEFVLAINHNSLFQIYKAGDSPTANGSLVVGVRDPDKQYDWKMGGFYYNPYYERRSVFIYRGDEKLVSMDGRSVTRNAFKDSLGRTWFEVIPQPINVTGLPPALRNMIQAIPQQVKAVSQSVMQNLNLRVPNDFNPTTPEDWFRWLGSIELPIGDRFKGALSNAASYKVVITKEVETEFLTGKVVAPGITVQIRMFQVREVVKRVREIHDTNYVSVHIPTDILAQGPEAVKNWIRTEPTLFNRFSLSQEPISENVIQVEVDRESPVQVVAYTRGTDYQWKNLWGNDAITANDMIREILEEP